MKKAIISYFSGTGNSRWVAMTIKTLFQQHQICTIDHNIEDDYSLYRGDYHVFVFPVYAMGIPHIMEKYVKSLPKVKDTKALVLAIHGEIDIQKSIPGHAGRSCRKMAKILGKRGYDVVISDRMGLPSNLTSLLNPPTRSDCQAMFDFAEKNLNYVTTRFLSNDGFHYRAHPILLMLAIPFEFLYRHIGRRMIGQMFVSGDECRGCGLCVKKCPAKNIQIMGNKPVWHFACEGCHRCINICPVKAIRFSLPRLGLLFLPWSAWALTFVPAKILPTDPIIIRTLMFGSYFILLALAFRCMIIIERLPFIGDLFRLNFTRFIRRYYRQ